MLQGHLTQSDPTKCVRVISPYLRMHRLSAQCWSYHTVSEEQGGNFCSFTTNPIAGVRRRNKSVIPGSQLCSQLSPHPQGHCTSSAHTVFSPTLTFPLQTFQSAPQNTKAFYHLCKALHGWHRFSLFLSHRQALQPSGTSRAGSLPSSTLG